MSVLTISIVAVFVIGYFCIALEGGLKVNKSAVALLMCVACWTLYMVSPMDYILTADPSFDGGQAGMLDRIGDILKLHLGETAETLFFLMGAMTIVEVVDRNGGFKFVRELMKSKSKRSLLWKIAFTTFFLSAILDNLTTSIVMIIVLKKLIQKRSDRLIYASLVIIAANSGGAFSPIGDVTTIMLWIGNMITTPGVMSEVFLPSLVSMVIPAFVLQFMVKGELDCDSICPDDDVSEFTKIQRRIIFFLGVGGLMFVPVFRTLTELPPFMGILLILGLLWTVTELFYRGKGSASNRVGKLLTRIDMSTILFFLGILMAVACLEDIGILTSLGTWLNDVSNGNHYLVTGIIGVVSSIVDNVPLVAGCMGMYPIAEVGDMAVDGIFWQLLAYCAGVGGSMLIIGSAAGVVIMGLEKISFGWYLKHISWIALLGYLSGMLVYWIQRMIFF